MSDGELVRQVLAGRADGYEELVRRWAGRVTALCHARVGRADVAEDLAQETLLRGYRAVRSLADPDKFGAWLCGIATRTCLDWLKAKERTQVVFSALGPDRKPEELLSSPDPHRGPDADHEDELRDLLRAVEDLPDEQRQVIMLYYYEDVTYRELGKMLGVSPATVNARLTKARAVLRERLNPCRR